MSDIDRSRAGIRRRIDELNRKHCRDARELRATLNQLVQLGRENIRQGIVITILAAFENLVRRTPVDTGRLRAGWRVSPVDAAFVPPEGAYPQYQRDNVSSAVSGAIEGAGQLTKADVIWIYNNVEYVLALNAGWSKRQPGGFIDMFLNEVNMKLNELAARA